MSTEENKATVRRDFEAWKRGNLTEILATVDELYAPDFVYHLPNLPFPGGIRSREDYKQFCTGFLAAFPDLEWTIEDIIAEGEEVVVRYTFHGTHQGEWRGVPATGKAVTFTGTITYRIVDGKVVEVWDSPDQLSMLRQLGLIPAQG